MEGGTSFKHWKGLVCIRRAKMVYGEDIVEFEDSPLTDADLKSEK